jgi:uncharacterized protein
MHIPTIIADELKLTPAVIDKVLALFKEGGTVPFVARYRKEVTGGLDEVALRVIEERHAYLTELEERKATVIKSIEEQQKMTPELLKKIAGCLSKTELEEIYLPYKPKRRTRATIAKEKGLEPLALKIMEMADGFDPAAFAQENFTTFKDVKDVADALKGAQDIIAEALAETAEHRALVHEHMMKNGAWVSTVKEEWKDKKTKFDMYYNYRHPVATIAGHNLLGMRRAEEEEVVNLTIEADDPALVARLTAVMVKGRKNASAQLVTALLPDMYERLMKQSIIGRVRFETKEKADEEAIETFATNLSKLLLSSPAGNRPIIGLDPGFRTGCKAVALDATGKLLEYKAIFPTEPQKDYAGASRVLYAWLKQYKVELIAIGNGTASRETEEFVRWALQQDAAGESKGRVTVVVVNESGASVYSASEVAAREFPDHDVTVRGAVSIARRLQDPLAELVKIDPKSIGVGQYQHDVNQPRLKKKLDAVVETCVNYVGVDVNTASAELLAYVAGLSAAQALEIVNHRKAHGAFAGRKQILDVKKMGPKAFEQSAGFLRIRGGDNPLDNSAVHPESYHLVEKMAQKLGKKPQELAGQEALVVTLKPQDFVDGKVGLPTINDIINELKKPGRDPRKAFVTAQFLENVKEVKDVTPGMLLEGNVTNVTKFGAFVDIGVHQDGLVHISELANRFVKDVHEVVSVGDVVKVKVLEVDTERKRIGLSMKQARQ